MPDLPDLSVRIAALSPEKRERLLQRLKETPAAVPPTSALPGITPDPEQRYAPFPLTDIQRGYWIGRSGLYDLGACANVFLEYEITYELPGKNLAWSWQALSSWLMRRAGRRYLENKVAAFFMERFNLALQRLIERHDMLRAVILPDGRQQVLRNVPAYQASRVDLRRQPPAQVESTLESLREQLRYRKAVVDQWPLFEFFVCFLDGGRIRLLVRIDPMIIDGDSRSNLIRELSRLLVAPASPLPPIEITYRDYAVTWAAFEASELYQQARAYWLSRLAAIPPAPELPLTQTLHPQTPVRFEFLSQPLLEPEAWQRLQARAAHAGLSASGIAMTAFVEVLAAWSRAPRFTLGLVGTYHPPLHPQIQDVFGNFNSLALLAVEDAPGTFEERARRLWQRLITDLDHRYFSGQQILQELNRLHRGSARAAVPVLFNSVIENSRSNHPARRHAEQHGSKTPGASLFQLSTVEIGSYFPQILLMVILKEEPHGALSCKWQFVDSVFPPGLIQDLVTAYRRLMQRLADDEQTWHSTTRQLVPPEQVSRRAALQVTERSAPPARLLHELFAVQVAQRPGQAAVVGGGRTLSYAEVYRRANQVGRRLRESGARPNTLVAVAMERGWEQVVAVLGVLASGAAYLPLDLQLNQDQLAQRLAYGRSKWVLTQSRLKHRFDGIPGIQPWCVDGDDEWTGVDGRPLDSIQGPGDLACVLDTSGVSERPRGVMLEHAGLVNTLLAVNRLWGVGPGDRLLALMPLSVDLSIYDVFGILAAGGTMVVPEPSTEWQAAGWADLMCREQVTLWNSTPALMERLLAGVRDHPHLRPSFLRLAFLSGDQLSTTLPRRLRSLVEGAQVVNLLGATEASIWSGYCAPTDAPPGTGVPSYGCPLPNQSLHVFDHFLEHRPVWVAGQLHLGGAGLARGYWEDEAETLARFIRHPQTGERLYRTGDLGRFLPDGRLEWLGREKDFQVTVRGCPIQPRQIEAALEQHPGVRDCAVLARQNANGRVLVAYVVPQSSQAPAVESLRDFLNEKLPGHRVPAVFMLVDEMPVTAAGQADRRALPAPDHDSSGHIAPRDSLELQLAQLWETLLDARPIGVTDNFFDLGGTSFLLTRLSTRLQREFNLVHLPAEFFADASIGVLAGLIRQQAGAPAPGVLQRIRRPGQNERERFL